MDIPAYDAQEFRYLLYRLFNTPLCTLDARRAANWLGINRTTLYRWLSGTQRVPHSVWTLVWMMGTGTLPSINGWDHWKLSRYWDTYSNQYVDHLVTPNGESFTPEDIMAWHFKSQLLHKLQKLQNKPKIKIEEIFETADRIFNLGDN